MKKEEEKFASSTVFEGFVSVRSVIEGRLSGSSDRTVTAVYCDKAKKEQRYKELSYLKEKKDMLGFEIIETDTEQIEKMCIGTSHGGIIAVCGERTLPVLKKENIPENGFFVLLEGIEDPYNFGYCLRSLYAAGVDGIIVSPRNWLSAAGVVCRSSAGASELFRIYTSDATDAAELFSSCGYTVAAADKSRDAVSVYDTDIKRPLFLMVGGEKRGITGAALDKADIKIMLDYGRPFRAALSAASAASVLAFEIFRRGRKA